jgi:predicted transcriptional regulator
METTLTIRLPEELKRTLQSLSEAENKPLSDLVRESLKNYLAVKRFRTLRNKTLPFAEAAGYLTDEDVFESLA